MEMGSLQQYEYSHTMVNNMKQTKNKQKSRKLQHFILTNLGAILYNLQVCNFLFAHEMMVWNSLFLFTTI